MKLYALHTRQVLNTDMETAWAFLSDPGNLATITPESMGFEVRSGAGEPMHPGQIISYTVRPLLNIPMSWVTEITHVEEPHYFVDEQRFGPYSMWHHQHRIFPGDDGGVVMQDAVHYVVPLGPIGRVMHSLIIKPQLSTIFEYRRLACAERFGELPGEHYVRFGLQ